MSQVWEVLPLRVGTKKGRAPSQCPARGLGESCWYLGASSRCHLVDHSFGDVGLQPDDGARTELDLLGKGALSHPSVDGAGA